MKLNLKGFMDGVKKAVSNFLGIFTETSTTSLMRFMSFFMFWFALYETHFIVSQYGKNLTTNQIFLIGILYVFSFFPKVAQKVIEKKYDVLEKKLKQQKSE